MSDPNFQDFYGRAARIETARRNGFGLEAHGTLGRSHYRRTPQRNRSFLRPLMFVLFAVLMSKAALLQAIGPQTYADRLLRMESGQDFDRLGAWLMQADPLTVTVAGQIGRIMGRAAI